MIWFRGSTKNIFICNFYASNSNFKKKTIANTPSANGPSSTAFLWVSTDSTLLVFGLLQHKILIQKEPAFQEEKKSLTY